MMKTGKRWDRLDNAALIYTSSLTNDYATKFRVSVTLDKFIDDTLLQEALLGVIDRFPSFRYALKEGLYWWYFKEIEEAPVLGNAAPLNSLPFQNNSGYLFQLSCQDCTVNLDVFHSLADGHGAMVFLLSVVAQYLKLREGIGMEYNAWVFDPAQTPSPQECEDCFDAFATGKGALEKDKAAYHVKGTEQGRGALDNTRISLDTASLVKAAKGKGCTVTEFLTAAMLDSIQTIWRKDRNPVKSPYVKISVPVDLRSMYGETTSPTLRNYSSYVNLGVDLSRGRLSLEEIISRVAAQKKEQTVPSTLRTKIVANVQLENFLAVRCLPRVVKREIMASINRAKGDKFCTQTLSNMGVIELPQSMKPFVKDLDFQLGRQITNFGACGCVSCNGRTNINISRKIVETEFEQNFLATLESLGVTVLSRTRTHAASTNSGKKSRGEVVSRQTVRFCSQTAFGFLMVPFCLLYSSSRLAKILGPFFLL